MINIEFINSLNVAVMFLVNVIFISFWGAVLVNYKLVKGYLSLILTFIATSLYSIKATLFFVKYVNHNSIELISTTYPFFEFGILICFILILFFNWNRIDKKYSYSYILVAIFYLISLILNLEYIKLIVNFVFVFVSYVFYMAVIISLKLFKNRKVL